MKLKTRVNSRYVIAMKIGNFSIPDKIKNNYKIEGDLSNIENWKAKVLLSNSANEDKTGQWDNIGYVGFNPARKIIVPIARSDEHQSGWELCNHLIENGLIPKGNYYAIWCLDGQNYIHHDAHLKEMIPVYKKWLELGGMNLRVSVRRDKGNSRYMSFQDVVDGNAGIEHKKGTLSTYGKELVDILEKLATLYVQATKSSRPNVKLIVSELLSLAEFIHIHRMAPLPQKEDEIKKAAHDLQDGKNLDVIMEGIFGFHGFKNEIHTSLKDAISKPDSWDARELSEFFGDVKFALDEFNRLSSI